MAALRLTVNGVPRALDVDPDTPLLWVLRDHLGLTGTKYGCGAGICGSCTVHLDGEPARSCQITVAQAAGRRVVTIEGLSPDGTHPVQRAWLEEYLARPDQPPTILVFHHPPTDEDSALLDSDRLLRIAARSRQVKAIIYGHSHAYSFQTQDGLHLVNVPAVGYNFTQSEPVGWVEATFTAEGGDLRLRAFAGNREQDGKIRSLRWR